MRRDAVVGFFEAIGKDEQAIERLRAASESVDAFTRVSVELGRVRGFEFEPDDVRETLDTLARRDEGGLTDQELSAVAGGVRVVMPGLSPGPGHGPDPNHQPIYGWIPAPPDGRLVFTIIGYR